MQLPFPFIDNAAAHCLCFRCNQIGHIAVHCPTQYLNNIVHILNKMSPALNDSYVPDKSGWTVPQFIGIMQSFRRSMPKINTTIRPFLLSPVSIIRENDIIRENNEMHEKIRNTVVVEEEDALDEVGHKVVVTEEIIVVPKDPVRQHIESNLPVKKVPSFPAHAVCFCNLCRKKNLAPEKWVQYTCGHGNCQDCVSSILKNRMPFEDADSIKCFCCWKISHHIYLLNE
jgi:hypothetical protein